MNFEWREILRFKILGKPIPKGRPRFANGRAYTPDATRRYVRLAAQCCALAMRTSRTKPVPKGVPVRVDCNFVFRRRGADYRKACPDGRMLKFTKPDRDNLDKSILEALEKSRLIANDSQVCAGEICKWWGAIADRSRRISEQPHVEVVVSIPTQE